MDIQKTTLDLLATGLTQIQLAGLVPCSQAAIQKFAAGSRGARPSFAIASALDKLHAQRCAAPKRTKRQSASI